MHLSVTDLLTTIISIKEIIGKLGMSDKDVPMAKMSKDWLVPDSLMFGQAQTRIDFDMGHRVEVHCQNYFKYHLRMISNKLCGVN